MTTFKQFISEAFDKPYPYTWRYRRDDLWAGHFTTKDAHEVSVTATRLGSFGAPYEVQFSRKSPTSKLHFGSTRTTGEGDEIRIFSTVIAMIREFVDAEDPGVIEFSAFKGPTDSVSTTLNKRGRLYATLCKKFAAEHGYAFKVINGDDYQWFTLLKRHK